MKRKEVDLVVMYQVAMFKQTGEWIDYEAAVQTVKEAMKG